MMKQKKVCACHNKLSCDLHHSWEALVVQILFMYLHNTYHSLATDLTHAVSKEDTSSTLSVKVQDRSYLVSFHIKNLSTLQKALIQVLPIQVKNSELICKDKWNLGLLDLLGFQVRRHFSFHLSWCPRGAASRRVQARAMTSVHPAHSTHWNSSSWPPTTCLGSIPISLASHDSELLQCVGEVSDYFIHVFWLQMDEASSSHRFLRGIQFLWEKFIDMVKQCQPLLRSSSARNTGAQMDISIDHSTRHLKKAKRDTSFALCGLTHLSQS